MSTIQEVSIKIAADVSDLLAKMREAEKTTNTTMTSMERSISIVKVAAAGLAGGLSISMFAGMIRGAVDTADNLNDLSKTTGLTVDTLAGLKLAAKQSGGDLEGIAGSVNKLSVAMGKDAERFKALGITAKDPLEAFKQLSDIFSSIEDPQLRAALGAEALGKSWQSAAPLLSEGGQKIGEMVEKGKALANVNQDMADKADQFNDQMAEMQAAVDGVKMKLAGEMLPAMTDITKAILEAYNESGKLSAVWVALGGMGAFLFTDEFSSATVKIKNLKAELDELLTDKDLADNAPAVGIVGRWLFGSSDLEGDIAKKRAAIKALQDQMEQPARDASAKAAASKAAAAEHEDAKRRVQEFLELDKAKKKAAEEAARAASAEAEKQRALVASLSGVNADYLEQLTRLGVVRDKGLLTEQQYTELVVQLIGKQPVATRQMAEMAKAVAEEDKAMLAAAQSHTKFVQSLQDGLAGMQADVDAQQEYNDRLGLSKDAIAVLDAAKLESQATTLDLLAIKKLDKDIDLEQYALYKAQAKELRELAALKKQGAAKETAIESAKEATAEWQRGWTETDRLARDVFTTWATEGGNAGQKIGDTLKKALLSAIYEATLKPIVFQIYASVMGGGGGASGASKLLGMGGSGGSGGGILDSLFGGAGGVGGSLGLFGSGFNAGLGAVFGEAGTLGGLSAGTTALGAGNIMGGLGTLAGTAMPWVAGAMVLKKLMDYKVTPDGGGLTASLTSTGTSTGQVGAFSQFRQEGGLGGGGNTTNRDWSVADTSTTSYIIENVRAGTEANKTYARILGLNASAIDGYTKNIEINTSGMDAAAAQAAIDAELNRFAAEQVSAAYGDALDAVARDGETSAQTLQRLATDVTGANAVMGQLGGTLFDVSTAGAAAASGLVQAMGGLAQFQAQMSAYYQSYYSAEEQRANVISQAQRDLETAGITGYTAEQISSASRADIRAAVQYYESRKDTAEGAKQYAAAIQVANRLSAVTPALDAIAQRPANTVEQVGSSGGGGGGGGASAVETAAQAIAKALQAGADALFEEADRIHGTMGNTGAQGLADLQAQFAIKTAKARATGDVDAVNALPAISQAMLEIAQTNAKSLQDLQWLRGQTAASLSETGNILASRYGLTVPAFDVGTNRVPRDMLAMVHKDETIIPAGFDPAAFAARIGAYAGSYSTGADFSGVAAEMSLLRSEFKEAKDELKKIAGNSKDSAFFAGKWEKSGMPPARATL